MITECIMKIDKSWMKINTRKFWMCAVCNQILIFLMKETKPKLVNEELIYQARAHHVSRILQKFVIGFPVSLTVSLNLTSNFFMRNCPKLNYFGDFIQIYFLCHICHISSNFETCFRAIIFCQKIVQSLTLDVDDVTSTDIIDHVISS